MTEQHQTGATITVTLRDGRVVTTSTWSACLGVGAFVASFLGQPAARHTLTTEEDPCPTTGSTAGGG